MRLRRFAEWWEPNSRWVDQSGKVPSDPQVRGPLARHYQGQATEESPLSVELALYRKRCFARDPLEVDDRALGWGEHWTWVVDDFAKVRLRNDVRPRPRPM